MLKQQFFDARSCMPLRPKYYCGSVAYACIVCAADAERVRRKFVRGERRWKHSFQSAEPMLNFKGAKRRYKPTASLKRPSNFQLRFRKGATAAKRVREKGYRTFFHIKSEVKRTLINGNRIIPRGSVYKIYTDMKTKYVQKVIPSISTKAYRNLTTRELRKKAIAEFDKHCRGKIPRNLHTGIPIRLDSSRKTARGEAIYRKKVAVIPKLCELLKHACYSNWGGTKRSGRQNRYRLL